MYSEKVIQVRIGAYLAEQGITPYRLAKTMQQLNGGRPSLSAVYAIVDGKNTPSLDTVNVVLNALSKLKGEPVPLDAILSHKVDD